MSGVCLTVWWSWRRGGLRVSGGAGELGAGVFRPGPGRHGETNAGRAIGPAMGQKKPGPLLARGWVGAAVAGGVIPR